MNLGAYGILVIFGLFIILTIVNPRLSCFGKKISSPLYPILRKKKMRAAKSEDYGFDLGGAEEKTKAGENTSRG
jgi:hypothetical protein